MTTSASQSCIPCRKLKRKCPRELPVCSLCKRLSKSCAYPIKVHQPPSTTIVHPSENLGGSPFGQSPAGELSDSINMAVGPPSSRALNSLITSRTRSSALFFLDPDSHVPTFDSGKDASIIIDPEVLESLQSTIAIQSLCEHYISTTHRWLPILSQKRLIQKVNKFNPKVDYGLTLLLLCMKLVSHPQPDRESSFVTSIYLTVKSLSCQIQNHSLMSLELLQSIVLLGVYELSNGIYPAAYFSVGYAARMGMMMGLHDVKNAKRFFKESDTWTQCEEERRAWWAVLIFDRYINIGVQKLPFATPEPLQETLLPCTESVWNAGEIGTNEPLFVSSFSASSEIGSFALACQAAHTLGLVLRHRDELESNTDPHFRLTEASRLHQALSSLAASLNERSQDNGIEFATSLCHSARLILYGFYGCNEHYSPSLVRIPEETSMQKTSIQGLKDVISGVSQLVERYSLGGIVTDGILNEKSPLIASCLFTAASECAWFVREDGDPVMEARLREIVGFLRHMERRWGVCDIYLESLKAEGVLDQIGN